MRLIDTIAQGLVAYNLGDANEGGMNTGENVRGGKSEAIQSDH